MPAPESKLSQPTAGAVRAMGLAELVSKVFRAERVKCKVGDHPGYALQMAPPEGASISGADRPKERLMLVPLRKTSGEVGLEMGTADPNLSEAKLRSFEALRAQHSGITGGDLPLDPDDYARVLERVRAFFERQGAPVTILSTNASSAAPVTKNKAVVPWIVVTLVILSALAYAAVRMR